MAKLASNINGVTTELTKRIVVFYHADCTDGFTAAWVAWKKFGNKADYIAYQYGDILPILKNKKIYTLDLTFEETGVLQGLMSQNVYLTSIDHHISNKDRTLSTHQPLYALDHSGCTLAWQYFFPNKPTPKFLLSIEDVDLWRHKIRGGHQLYLYLDLFNFDFKVYSKIISDFENPKKRKAIFDTGELLLKYNNKLVNRRINKNAHMVKFEGYNVYAINSGSASDTGEVLYRMHPPFAIIWRENKTGGVAVSLRGNGEVDLSLIAKKYGGGGHHNSAAFHLKSLKNIPWRNI